MLLNAFALLRRKQLFKRLCHGLVVHFVTVNEELLVDDKMTPLCPKKYVSHALYQTLQKK